MQDKQTLLDLGFIRHKEWENKQFTMERYRLDLDGLTFSAHVYGPDQGFHGENTFVTIGLVVDGSGIVSRWIDCCSPGSVKRKINQIRVDTYFVSKKQSMTPQLTPPTKN